MKFSKSWALDALVVTVLGVLSTPAFAQFQKATQALNQVQGWILSVAGIIFTICAMFVGFRMMAGGAQWKDVAPVFWGGAIVAGATALSALFF